MRPNNWEGLQCPGVPHFQILSCCLVTAAAHCGKFCWNLLKSRAKLFTSNDLWSRFKYLHPWYSKLIPRTHQISHSYSYKGLFCFWASDQLVLLTHLLNSWAAFSKEPFLTLSQEASGLASGARREQEWCWCYPEDTLGNDPTKGPEGAGKCSDWSVTERSTQPSLSWCPL